MKNNSTMNSELELEISFTNDKPFPPSECNFCFAFTPKWTRILSTQRVFAFVYGIIAIIQGIGFFYLITTMTTIELHFQLPSESFGVVMSLSEIILTCAAFIVGLLIGPNCHRPRAIGFIMAAMGIGCHLLALPYYLYGPPTPYDVTYSNISDASRNFFLCVKSVDNSTFSVDEDESKCRVNLKAPDVSVGVVTAYFLIGYVIYNVGGIALFVVGTPFVDDNVENKNSPMYIGALCSFRSLGPVVGTLLSSLFLSIYVDPKNPPWFDSKDDRWVGAWWIGFVVLGCLCFLCAFLVAQFPRRLYSKKVTPAMKIEMTTKRENKNKFVNIPSPRELIANLRRIIVNKLLWFRVLSEIFTWFGHEGFTIFLPKYLEREFQMTSSQASFWTGFSHIAPLLFGNLLVGYVIKKFKLTVRQLSLCVIIGKIIEIATIIALFFIRCKESFLIGSGNNEPICDWANCDCSSAILSPVCGSDGSSYFSACHAGCSESILQNGTYIFNNCSCVTANGFAEPQLCNSKCFSKVLYLTVVAVSSFAFSIEFIASVLFMLRCVEPKDKTLSTGFLSALLGLFTFMPCPIIISAAVDSSCLIWNEQCGRRSGACDVYDMEKFRSILHLPAIILLSIGILWDMLFWRFSKDKMSLFTDSQVEIEEID